MKFRGQESEDTDEDMFTFIFKFFLFILLTENFLIHFQFKLKCIAF